MMLQMIFDFNPPAGLIDNYVWVFESVNARMHGRTDAGLSPIL